MNFINWNCNEFLFLIYWNTNLLLSTKTVKTFLPTGTVIDSYLLEL